MRLKRLELSGFKTFADRTPIEFASQITGIVGPNGSGKSNIFDAVRWALGEGSLRSLRSVRTEDIIFAGTERRRPLAMAEVTLTLDNEDGTLALPGPGDNEDPPTPLAFAEVTVTRRAMRNAESQYFINGISCRLRDIQTMFLGTGLGGHSYALITQGEVEEMLNATPEERRMILEEAAGLAKYKRRRYDAERRMAAAAATLLRVGDILGELDAQAVQLAAQAEAAERYQAQTREMRTLELALQVEEVRRCTRSHRRVREHLEEITSRRRDTEETLLALAEERGALDRRTGDAGREWEELQRAHVGLAERRVAAEAAIELVAERLRGIDLQRERVERDLGRLRAEQEALQREQAALLEAERDLASQEDGDRAAVEAAETALRELEADAARGEDDVAAGRDEARALVEARARTQIEIRAVEAREAAHRDRSAALGEQIAAVQQQTEAMRVRQATLAGEQASAAAVLQDLRDRLAARRAELEDHAARREALLADERQLEVERERLASRLRYLEEAQAQYEGYEDGARRVLRAWHDDPGRVPELRGTLADFITVAPPLRVALEAALGSGLSALVVDSVKDAQEVLARLGGPGAGPVTFMPLSAVGEEGTRPLTPDLAADPAVLGRAADLVEITGGRHGAIRTVLGDALIVQDLEAAVRIRANGYRGRIVSLAGEVLAAEGWLILHRRPADMPSVLGRVEEIAELRAALARAEAAVDQLSRRREDLAARIREGENAAAQAETSVTRQAEVLGECRRRLTLVEAEVGRLAGEAARLAVEQAAADREATAQGAHRDRLGGESEAIAVRLAEAEARISALSAQLRDQAAARREAASRLTDLKIRLTTVGGKREALRTRRGEIDRALAQSLDRSRETQAEAQGIVVASAQLAADREAGRARCEALDAESVRLAAAQAALDADRAAFTTQRADLDRRHREAQARAAAAAEDAHRAEVRQAQVEAELGSARRRLEEEFGIPFERAAGSVPETVDREETLGQIEALRGLIAAMGPVNLLAIEEHRQVAARAQALRVQMEDTQGAIAALRSLIQRLEDVIREQFDKTFRAVHEEFGALFVRLFEGGRAGLELVPIAGSDEPGIDIVAQPPGKKLRSLGALSGGERVMVALALAFAMLRVRPSPFCVFDEVEAALDEANTRKVTEVLRELARRTQIIVITHNKATMEASDVLFGVTMEESGISRIVSVRLVDPEQLSEPQPVG